jgi:hypothetical protein
MRKPNASSRSRSIDRIVVPIVVALVGSAGFWAYLQGIFPFQVRPSSQACQINVAEISLERAVIEVNQSIGVSVRADNPDGSSLLYNWQAAYGQMNPSVRSKNPQSVYTAPATPVDDTISVDITLANCNSVRKTQDISVLAAPTPIAISQASASALPSASASPPLCAPIVGNWESVQFDGTEPSFEDTTIRPHAYRFLEDGTYTGRYIASVLGGAPGEIPDSGTYSCIDTDTIKIENKGSVTVYDFSVSGDELKLSVPGSYTVVLRRLP